MTASNRTTEGQALLAEIDEWTARTKTPPGRLGTILFRHPGFVSLLRRRFTVTEESEAKVRQFLAEHPNGTNGVAVPRVHILSKLGPREAQMRLLAAVTDHCGLCGHAPSTACTYPTCRYRSTK